MPDTVGLISYHRLRKSRPQRNRRRIMKAKIKNRGLLSIFIRREKFDLNIRKLKNHAFYAYGLQRLYKYNLTTTCYGSSDVRKSFDRQWRYNYVEKSLLIVIF